jgi:hypothetical protein
MSGGLSLDYGGDGVGVDGEISAGFGAGAEFKHEGKAAEIQIHVLFVSVGVSISCESCIDYVQNGVSALTDSFNLGPSESGVGVPLFAY